jgi:hypothetical protein
MRLRLANISIFTDARYEVLRPVTSLTRALYFRHATQGCGVSKIRYSTGSHGGERRAPVLELTLHRTAWMKRHEKRTDTLTFMVS